MKFKHPIKQVLQEILRTRQTSRRTYRGRSRRNRYRSTYVTTYQDVLKFIQLETKGYGYTEAPLLRIRRFEKNSKGQRYQINPLKYGRIETSVDQIGRVVSISTEGDFVWPSKVDCTYTTLIDEYVPKKTASGTEKYQESQLETYLGLASELTNFENTLISDDNIDARVGFLQYETERDVRTESLYYSPSTDYYAYHSVGDEKYQRTIVDETSDTNVSIPNGYSFVIPVIDETIAIPERAGQVYGGLKVTSILAGGIIPFYIGRETATGVNGVFLSAFI